NVRGSSGIPLLSKIPILGAAFGSQSLTRKRTELVLIITPKIVSDGAQAREVTNELREKMPALKTLLPPPAKGPQPASSGKPGRIAGFCYNALIFRALEQRFRRETIGASITTADRKKIILIHTLRS